MTPWNSAHFVFSPARRANFRFPQTRAAFFWGGVGCNGMHCTCAHVPCYAIALAHMLDATQLYVHTCSMLRPCTCTHARCYAVVLAHMLDATQFFLSTHAWCYAIVLKHTCSMYLISLLPVSWIKSKENSTLVCWCVQLHVAIPLAGWCELLNEAWSAGKKSQNELNSWKRKPARVFLQPTSMWNTKEWRDDINKTTGSSTTPWPIFRGYVSFREGTTLD